ncbi:MAG: response regulator transcription factor [Kiritimatiellota bacterium]|nr:response regulator transcription factor [Kiritimatiellota bacterium]
MRSKKTRAAGRKAQILIVDAQPIVREALSRLIQQQKDMQVSLQYNGFHDALKALKDHAPDAAVIGVALHNGFGLEQIQEMKRLCPAMKVVVFSACDENQYAFRSFRAGAGAYISKNESAERVVAGLREALKGKIFMHDQLRDQVMAQLLAASNGNGNGEGAREDALTDRELRVFEHLGSGLSTRQISERLHLSIKTIQGYRERIKRKLKIKTGSELVHRANHWQAKLAPAAIKVGRGNPLI